jgi:hypothetical protein
VPRAEVEAELELAMTRWDVRELAPDPPGWHAEIEGWEEKWGDTVVRFDTNQPARFAPACDRLKAAVNEAAAAVRRGEVPALRHDGDPTVARHVSNAATRVTPHGRVIAKDYADSPRKIDAAVTSVVAYSRATALAGAKPERGPRLW